jgi:hypothetical protein
MAAHAAFAAHAWMSAQQFFTWQSSHAWFWLQAAGRVHAEAPSPVAGGSITPVSLGPPFEASLPTGEVASVPTAGAASSTGPPASAGETVPGLTVAASAHAVRPHARSAARVAGASGSFSQHVIFTSSSDLVPEQVRKDS